MVDIRSTVQGSIPSVPFEKIAHMVLGSSYALSIVICGDRLAQRLNTEYRDKTYSPNVLSFSLSDTEGEIVLNLRKAEREARIGNISTQARVALLFVHGCCHLKGHDHSDAMEKLEQKVLKKCGF